MSYSLALLSCIVEKRLITMFVNYYEICFVFYLELWTPRSLTSNELLLGMLNIIMKIATCNAICYDAFYYEYRKRAGQSGEAWIKNCGMELKPLCCYGGIWNGGG